MRAFAPTPLAHRLRSPGAHPRTLAAWHANKPSRRACSTWGILRIAGLLTGILVLHACHPPMPWWQRRFSGRVVDAETGEPIRNAVVVAIWCGDHIRMDGGPDRLWIKETLTDADGRFRIWPRPAVVLNPFEWPMRPELGTFRPGYSECRRSEERRNPDCRPPTIRLHKLSLAERTASAAHGLGSLREDLRLSTTREPSGFCLFLPARDVPELAKLVQAEDTLRGYKYYGNPLPDEEIARLWRIVLGRSESEQPPPFPVPAELRWIRPDPGLHLAYLGVVEGGRGARFRIGDAPPFEVRPGASLPNGDTFLFADKYRATLRFCPTPEVTVLLGLHGQEPCNIHSLSVEKKPD